MFRLRTSTVLSCSDLVVPTLRSIPLSYRIFVVRSSSVGVFFHLAALLPHVIDLLQRHTQAFSAAGRPPTSSQLHARLTSLRPQAALPLQLLDRLLMSRYRSSSHFH
jgi:hypothetical protein